MIYVKLKNNYISETRPVLNDKLSRIELITIKPEVQKRGSDTCCMCPQEILRRNIWKDNYKSVFFCLNKQTIEELCSPKGTWAKAFSILFLYVTWKSVLWNWTFLRYQSIWLLVPVQCQQKSQFGVQWRRKLCSEQTTQLWYRQLCSSLPFSGPLHSICSSKRSLVFQFQPRKQSSISVPKGSWLIERVVPVPDTWLVHIHANEDSKSSWFD